MIGPATIEDIRPFLIQHDISTVGEFLAAYDAVEDPNSDLEKVYRRVEQYPGNTLTMERDGLDTMNLTTET